MPAHLTRRHVLLSAASVAAVAAMPAGVAIAAVEGAPVAASAGWTHLIASVVSGGKTIVKITDWFGGTGPKPPVTYVGENGVVLDPAEAAELVRLLEWT